MPDISVIDPQALENLRALTPGDNDEFLREIVTIFLTDTPQRIAELDASLAAADVEKFVRAAHSIKGSSSNLGAVTVRAAAEKLEYQGRKEGLAQIGAPLASLKAEFARARTELARLLPGPPPAE
jgi:HPt (histidine-containing phosphotransfer) domain-containing protein